MRGKDGAREQQKKLQHQRCNVHNLQYTEENYNSQYRQTDTYAHSPACNRMKSL